MPALVRTSAWLALAVLLVVPAARAHQPGLSRLDLRVGAPRITAELVFARPELIALVPGADADRSGQLDEVELLAIEAPLGDALLGGIELAVDGAACPGAIDRIAFVEEDGLAVSAGFACPPRAGPPDAVSLRLPLIARLAAGHRVLGRAVFADMSQGPGSSAQPLDFVAHRRRSALTIRRPTAAPEPAPAPALAPAPAPAAAPPPPAPRWPWLLLAAAPLGLWAFRRRRPRS